MKITPQERHRRLQASRKKARDKWRKKSDHQFTVDSRKAQNSRMAEDKLKAQSKATGKTIAQLIVESWA